MQRKIKSLLLLKYFLRKLSDQRTIFVKSTGEAEKISGLQEKRLHSHTIKQQGEHKSYAVRTKNHLRN